MIGQDVQRAPAKGHSIPDAVARGSTSVIRAVLTTAAVAALGFLPMALSSGAGSEVQRPLATAVAAGIAAGAFTTLLVLSGILVEFLRGYPAAEGKARPSDSLLIGAAADSIATRSPRQRA